MTVVAALASPCLRADQGEDLESSAPAGCQHISNLEQLHEVTGCGLTALSLQQHVRSVAVTNQGKQLGYWPPGLCQFSQLTCVNLSGNAITFIPQSVQMLPSLQQLLLSRNDIASLPPEVSCLTNLTELDLGSNQIRKLPDSICALTGLKVLNVWGNLLTALPDNFGALTSLVRLGLKGNQLAALPDSFCQLTNLVELFLTDNKLTTLPQGFGSLKSLVKLQASYNPFVSLPDGMWCLPALELFRLAVGHLTEWPSHLLEAGGLPKLAWCSIGSNPAAAAAPALPETLPRVTRHQLSIGTKLGQGASGEVFMGQYQGQPVAVKIFVAGASPDGSTHEEIRITCHNNHPSLTKVLALLVASPDEADPAAAAATTDDADEGAIGLVMELVRGQPLADRPTSQHLLRCKWPADKSYSSSSVAKICHGLSGALAHLHSQGVCHGDIYAHNIMLEGEAHAVLCDFGAAFRYTPSASGGFWEAMEVRAFGLFMQGLVERIDDSGNGGCSSSSSSSAAELGAVSESSSRRQKLELLVARCLADEAAARPGFAELEQVVVGLM